MASAATSIQEWLIDHIDVGIMIVILVITLALLFASLGTSKNLPPGPSPWPVLGTYPQIAKVGGDKLHLFYKIIQEKYGPVVQLYFGRFSLVMLFGYDNVHDVIVNRRDVDLGRPDFIPGVNTSKTQGRNKGVAFANDAPWVEGRTVLLSAVRVELKSPAHEDGILEEVKNMVKICINTEGSAFTPRDHLLSAALAWHLNGVVGKRFSQEDVAYQNFLKFFMYIVNNLGGLSPFGTIPLIKYITYIGKSYGLYVAGYVGFNKNMQAELEERKSVFDENRIDSVLDVFIKEQRNNPDNETFSDENIVLTMADHVIGGAFSVAYTIDWALLYNVAYPHIQERCQKEIEKVCGKTGPVRFSHLDKLPYVCATVYEAQRKGSVVPTSIPYCAQKDIKIKGYDIPRGTMITGNLASLHMDPTQWSEPELFNPERFLNQDGKLAKKPPAFAPFGIGARICAGYSLAEKEIILVFANLLQYLVFSPSGKVNFEGKYTQGIHPESNKVEAKIRTHDSDLNY